MRGSLPLHFCTRACLTSYLRLSVNDQNWAEAVRGVHVLGSFPPALGLTSTASIAGNMALAGRDWRMTSLSPELRGPPAESAARRRARRLPPQYLGLGARRRHPIDVVDALDVREENAAGVVVERLVEMKDVDLALDHPVRAQAHERCIAVQHAGE